MYPIQRVIEKFLHSEENVVPSSRFVYGVYAQNSRVNHSIQM